MSRIYTWIWTRWPGRPWTHAIRDSYQKHRLQWLFCTFGLGIVIGHIFWGDDHEDI